MSIIKAASKVSSLLDIVKLDIIDTLEENYILTKLASIEQDIEEAKKAILDGIGDNRMKHGDETELKQLYKALGID